MVYYVAKGGSTANTVTYLVWFNLQEKVTGFMIYKHHFMIVINISINLKMKNYVHCLQLNLAHIVNT